MLVCHLDDSGKDKENSITTLAGYVAREEDWATFEQAVEPIFQQYIGNTPLHAKDLHHTINAFENWTVLKKQSFVAQICLQLARIGPLGVSMSVQKKSYAKRALEAILSKLRKRTITPYSFCFKVILEWILTDRRTGKLAHDEGIAFIVEAGNEHNNEIREVFEDMRQRHQLGAVLRSISFVSKGHSRAIQMADLFAYFTRRHGVAMERLKPEDRAKNEPEQMMKIIAEGLQCRSFVATDFGPEASGQRFFGKIGQNLP